MSNHRIRIFSSLLIAFIVVNVYANFTGIKETFANFKLPNFNVKKLFTLNFPSPSPTIYNNLQPFITTKPITSPTIYNNLKPFITPTKGRSRLTPTRYSSPTRPIQPTVTSRPKPTVTKYIKPTKVPTLPPITTDARPGDTLRSIFEEVSKRVCFPPALLMAFQTEETGAWVNINEPSSSVKKYNFYGWWNNPAIDPCHGFGFDEATGLSSNGVFCMRTPGANPGQMGLFSLNQFEEDAARKYTKSILPNNLDRRVWFDDALIFAIITKNRIGNPPKNCNDWPDDAIKTAAEKHQGSCGNNYCVDVLKYYKQYR